MTILVFPWLCPDPPPPVGNCTCGEANRATRIINGTETEVHEYPWQVGIIILSKYPSCGGAIISSQHILTAAHCTYFFRIPLNATYIRVSVGEHNIADSDVDIRNLSKVTVHPEYDKFNQLNDIAILTLSSPLTFSKSMAPICLPEGTSNTFAGDTATVIGWGRTGSPPAPQATTLQEVDLTVTTNEFCKTNYSDIRDPWPIVE